MSYIIAGLGNPGEEFSGTRHNTGRMMLEAIAKKFEFGEFKENLKNKALVAEGKIGKEKVLLIEPNNFMNRSGPSLVSCHYRRKKSSQSYCYL
jgi:PTH1 family peptidyl-tRNA hydrolase